uniref:hypothetical protein n=1 Tax=Ningiella ruwaisensis TaxID=2364274 RepID=UPI00109FC431|nr:hypothetical protein [Ningiella ruwaisensis]
MKHLFLLSAFLLFSSFSFADDTFRVSTSVYVNGELLGSPEMILESNKSATLSIGESFNYRVTVHPKSINTAEIVTELSDSTGAMNPRFVVEYGKEASIEIGEKLITVLVTRELVGSL